MSEYMLDFISVFVQKLQKMSLKSSFNNIQTSTVPNLSVLILAVEYNEGGLLQAIIC